MHALNELAMIISFQRRNSILAKGSGNDKHIGIFRDRLPTDDDLFYVNEAGCRCKILAIIILRFLRRTSLYFLFGKFIDEAIFACTRNVIDPSRLRQGLRRNDRAGDKFRMVKRCRRDATDYSSATIGRRASATTYRNRLNGANLRRYAARVANDRDVNLLRRTVDLIKIKGINEYAGRIKRLFYRCTRCDDKYVANYVVNFLFRYAPICL